MPAASAATVIAGRAYVLIEAVDKTGRVLKIIGQSLRRLKQFIPTLRSVLKLINQVGMRLRQIGNTLRQIGGAMASRGLQMLFNVGLMGIPVVAGIRQYRDFSDAWLAVRAVLEKTDAEIGELKKKILALGAATSYTSAEIAGAAEELARGGFNPEEVEAALQHVLALGRAGKVDLPTGARSMARIIRAFRMEATDAQVVADQLFTASTKGVATVEELMTALSFVAGTAESVNMNFATTVGVLSQLANNMLVGTKGGTAFNNMLLRMATKADQVKEKLGVDVFDLQGQTKDPVTLLTEIIQAMRKLSDKDRAGISSIFNIRGYRAANAMEQIEQIISIIEEIEQSSGKAKKAADTMDSDMGGSIRRIISYFNNLAIAWGSTFAKPIMELEKTLQPVLEGLGEWIKKNADLGRKILIFLAGVAGVGVALLALGIAVKVAGVALVGFGAIVSAVTFLAPLIAKLALILGLFKTMTFLPGDIGKAFKSLETVFLETFGDIYEIARNAFVAIKDLIMAGNIEGAMNVLMVSLKSIMDLAWIGLKKSWLEFTFFFEKAFHEAIGGIKIAWEEMKNWLAKKMLDFASDNKFFNWLFKQISGVDIQEERERSRRLGTDPDMAQNILQEQMDEKRRQIIDEQNAKIAALTEETEKLRTEYDKEREEAKRQADQAIKMAKLEPRKEPKKPGEGLGGVRMFEFDLSQMGKEVKAGQVEGLEFGSTEAVKQAHDNEKKMVDGINKTANGVNQLVNIVGNRLPQMGGVP